jgi:hypothetical protein
MDRQSARKANELANCGKEAMNCVTVMALNIKAVVINVFAFPVKDKPQHFISDTVLSQILEDKMQ